jgi:hypothetical protein
MVHANVTPGYHDRLTPNHLKNQAASILNKQPNQYAINEGMNGLEEFKPQKPHPPLHPFSDNAGTQR